ncbi:MAG: hypothetical protein ACREUY_05315, partial [Burkholderiales bacterium]
MHLNARHIPSRPGYLAGLGVCATVRTGTRAHWLTDAERGGPYGATYRYDPVYAQVCTPDAVGAPDAAIIAGAKAWLSAQISPGHRAGGELATAQFLNANNKYYYRWNVTPYG